MAAMVAEGRAIIGREIVLIAIEAICSRIDDSLEHFGSRVSVLGSKTLVYDMIGTEYAAGFEKLVTLECVTIVLNRYGLHVACCKCEQIQYNNRCKHVNDTEWNIFYKIPGYV